MRISDWSSDVCSSDLDRPAPHVFIFGKFQVSAGLQPIRELANLRNGTGDVCLVAGITHRTTNLFSNQENGGGRRVDRAAWLNRLGNEIAATSIQVATEGQKGVRRPLAHYRPIA